MGRAKTILQSEFPYNISARCINKEWFNLPMEDVWQIFSDEIFMVSILHNWRVHQFVLMNNHYHIIVSTPDANLSQCMHRFMGNVSRRLNERGNRINETFAGRYYKTILHKPSYFLCAYKYNYRNPVKAGVCLKVQDYPYSSLNGLLGKRYIGFSVQEDQTLFFDLSGTLRWLNTEPPNEKWEAVRWALKKPYFVPKKDASFRKPLLEEGELL